MRVLIAAEASIFHVDRWERKEGPSLSGCMSVRRVSPPLVSRKWATASLPVLLLLCCVFRRNSMFYSELAAVMSRTGSSE